MSERKRILITLLMPENGILNNIRTEQDIIKRIDSLLGGYFVNGQIERYLVCDDELISERLKDGKDICG